MKGKSKKKQQYGFDIVDNDEQAENSADCLGCDRCEGSSSTSPLCDNDKEEVEEDVEHCGECQEDKRCPAVTDGAQDAG